MSRKSTDRRESSCLPREKARGLLPGRPGFAEMGERGRDLLAAATHRLTPQSPGAVRRADERSGHHSEEADALRLLGELDELLGPDPAVHGVVTHRGPQVLRDRQEVAAGVMKGLQRLDHLTITQYL